MIPLVSRSISYATLTLFNFPAIRRPPQRVGRTNIADCSNDSLRIGSLAKGLFLETTSSA
jgi:hypothetical protein